MQNLITLVFLSILWSVSIINIGIGIYYKKPDEFKEVTFLVKFLSNFAGIIAIFQVVRSFFIKQTLSLNLIVIFSLILLLLSIRYEKSEKEKSRRNYHLSILKNELIPIEKYLKRDDELMEDPLLTFSRIGPTWYHFERGFVVERKEVDDILKRIRTGRTFLHGSPGKGKSVILNWIGYKLAQEKETVFVLPFKEKIPNWDKAKLIDLCNFLKETQSFLLIDDIHLDNLKLSEQLYDYLSDRVLFASRTKTSGNNKAEKFRFEKEFQNIKPLIIEENIIEELINLFENIKKENIPEFSIDQNIKTELIEKYKTNLRLLALQLYAHKNDNNIITKLKDIKEGIRYYIRNELNIPCAEDILLLISLLHKYEIAIRNAFIIDILGNDCVTKIDALCQRSEIYKIYDNKNGWDYLRMHHSEDAKVYAQAYDLYPDLGRTVKRKLDKSIQSLDDLTWNEKFYLSYINSFHEEGLIVLSRLEKEIERKIVNYPSFKTTLLKIFEKIKEFYDEYYLYIVLDAEEIVKDIFRDISLESIEKKIKDLDDPWGIYNLLHTLEMIGYKQLDQLRDIDVNIFIEKIINWDDPVKIAQLLKNFDYLKYTLIHFDNIINIEHEVYVNKINKWQDLWSIAWLIETLKAKNYKYMQKLLDNIDKNQLINKIRKCHHPGDIAYLIETLKKVEFKYLKDIFDNIDQDELINKIIKWDNPNNIAHLINVLHRDGYPYAKKVMNGIPHNVFISKIMQWHSSFDVAFLIRILNNCGYIYFNHIRNIDFNIFKEKITKANDPWQIAKLIDHLEYVKYNHVNKIREMDPDIFIKMIMITKEDSFSVITIRSKIAKIVELVKALHRISYPHITQIINSLPTKERNEIITLLKEKNPNIYKDIN